MRPMPLVRIPAPFDHSEWIFELKHDGEQAAGTYHTDGVTTSWFKIKNPTYSQMTGRREAFEHRQIASRPRRTRLGPILCAELRAVAPLRRPGGDDPAGG